MELVLSIYWNKKETHKLYQCISTVMSRKGVFKGYFLKSIPKSLLYLLWKFLICLKSKRHTWGKTDTRRLWNWPERITHSLLLHISQRPISRKLVEFSQRCEYPILIAENFPESLILLENAPHTAPWEKMGEFQGFFRASFFCAC